MVTFKWTACFSFNSKREKKSTSTHEYSHWNESYLPVFFLFTRPKQQKMMYFWYIGFFFIDNGAEKNRLTNLHIRMDGYVGTRLLYGLTIKCHFNTKKKRGRRSERERGQKLSNFGVNMTCRPVCKCYHGLFTDTRWARWQLMHI